MLWFLVLLCIIQKHVCKHEYYEKKDLRSQQPEKLLRETQQSRDSCNKTGIHQKLRITFNTTDLGDKYKEIFDQMFEDIKDFLSFLEIDEGSRQVMPEHPNTDLYIRVYNGTFSNDDTTIASAAPRDYSKCNNRPIKGEIKINKNKIEEYKIPQYLNGTQRDYITTLLHELQHVLVFSNTLFEKWVPNNPTKEIYNLKYDIKQKFITTPYLKEWVHSRFFVHSKKYSEFGLELEDDGGGGTAGTHPNSRLYFTDIMQGVTYGPAYISPILFLSYLDSGWYHLNNKLWKERVELLPYLDLTLTQSTELQTERLLDNPAYKAYPSSYICKKNSTFTCFPGNLYKAFCNLTKVNTSEKKNGTWWYYPSNDALIGQESTLDNAPVYTPYESCQSTKEEDSDIGEVYGNSSICVMTLGASIFHTVLPTPKCVKAVCRDDNRLSIEFKGKSYLCQNDGDTLTIPGYPGYIICPPARATCTIKALHKKDEKMIPVKEMMPDSGTYEGNNYVQINGFGYTKYNDITITIGGVKCNPTYLTDDYIICQLDKGKEDNKGKKVDVVLESKNITTIYPEFYLFEDYKYPNL